MFACCGMGTAADPDPPRSAAMALCCAMSRVALVPSAAGARGGLASTALNGNHAAQRGVRLMPS